MKDLRTTCIVLFGALLLVGVSVPDWAQAAQQTGDQSQSDSSTATKEKKKKTADAPAAATPAPAKSTNAAPAATPVSKPTAPAAAPKPPTAQQAPPADHSGMVWVNTASGVYHKPGTHWYGKTKQGKYMTEADAKKAGYRPAKE